MLGGQEKARKPCLSEKTPEELAILAQGGSLPAYAELVTRFQGRLYNFLLRRTRRAADAEDLAQETFVRAWQRLQSYDPQWRVSTWLFTIAQRLAVSHHRKQRRETGLAAPERVGAAAAESRLELRESRAGAGRVWALAERVLTEDQRTAVWLRYAEDLAISEIAVVMGKSHVGVRVCLFRARQSLASALNLPRAVTIRAVQADISYGDEMERGLVGGL